MLDIGQDHISQIREISEKLAQPEFQEALKKAKDKSLIVVLGPTGAGKSCVVNYLLGSRYDTVNLSDTHQTLVLRSGSVSEKSVVGNNTMESQTFVPGVHADAKNNSVLCDFPGFGDTRGSVAAVSATAMCQGILQAGKGIKKILLTLDAPTVMTSRGNHFFQHILSLKKMLGEISDEALSTVLIVLTKFPRGISNQEFVDHYIHPKVDELKSRQEFLTEDEQNLLEISEYLAAHVSQFVFVDLCDNGESAEYLLSRIDAETPHFSGKVDLLSCDIASVAFMAELTQIVSSVTAGVEYEKGLSERICQLENQIKDHNNEVSQKLSEINRGYDELSERAKKLGELKTFYEKQVDSIKFCLENESENCTINREALAQCEAELNRINQLSQPVLVSTQRLVVNPNQDGARIAMMGITAALIRGNRTNVNRAFEKTHTFVFESPAPICAVHLNGNALPLAGNVNQNHLAYAHTYSIIKGTQAIVEVFIRECDTAENQKNIQALTAKIPVLQQACVQSHDIALSIQQKHDEEQEKLIRINTKLMEIESEKVQWLEAFTQIESDIEKQYAEIQLQEVAIEEDVQQCRNFRRACAFFSPLLKNIVDFLSVVGKMELSSCLLPLIPSFVYTKPSRLFLEPVVPQKNHSPACVISSVELTP